MSNEMFQVGTLVRVTSYGPFRGLKGTIQRVDALSDDPNDPLCFYLVALEETSFRTPIWFEYQELEGIGFLALASVI